MGKRELLTTLPRLVRLSVAREFATVNPGKSNMTQEESEKWTAIQNKMRREALTFNYRNRGFGTIWVDLLKYGTLLLLSCFILKSVELRRDPKGRLKIFLLSQAMSERFACSYLACLRDMFPDEAYSEDDERYDSREGSEFLGQAV